MKYSLRSLMLVVTLVGLALGVVRLWNENRQHCLTRSNYHGFQMIRVGERLKASHLFEAPEVTKARQDALNAPYKYHNDENNRLREAYNEAVWRPWMRLWIDRESDASPEIIFPRDKFPNVPRK
ncbi:MAG: hypothetical protein ACKVP0_08075 [Pirellulaceae bacterium]